MSKVFECEIQARMRDVNVQGHVDNVEALRIVDEARALFLRHSGDLTGSGPFPNILGSVPHHVDDIVVAHRVEYRLEMHAVRAGRFTVSSWITRRGSSSFDVASELALDADGKASMAVATTVVLYDRLAAEAWAMSPEVQRRLGEFAGEPLEFRA